MPQTSDNREEATNFMYYHKSKKQTDILKGIQLDEPAIFLPWAIKEKDFIELLQDREVSIVAEKYYYY